MSTEIIRDSHEQVLGYIETRFDGKQIAKDTRYRIKGYYDPKANETRDFSYTIIGTGNLLASLIIRS